MNHLSTVLLAYIELGLLLIVAYLMLRDALARRDNTFKWIAIMILEGIEAVDELFADLDSA